MQDRLADKFSAHLQSVLLSLHQSHVSWARYFMWSDKSVVVSCRNSSLGITLRKQSAASLMCPEARPRCGFASVCSTIISFLLTFYMSECWKHHITASELGKQKKKVLYWNNSNSLYLYKLLYAFHYLLIFYLILLFIVSWLKQLLFIAY